MREIVRRAFELVVAMEQFVAHARAFYYEVMLCGLACRQCGGSLSMIGEGRCRCMTCAAVFDPTVAFQRCAACEGRVGLRICRYRCLRCGAVVRSRFVFDANVYNAEYFRERMAQSRQRMQERRQQAHDAAIGSRSDAAEPPAIGLDSVPGLVDALNGLVGGAEAPGWALKLTDGFDCRRYEAHLEACLLVYETRFDDLPALIDDARLDRIWRFVALIFLAHAGRVELRQDPSGIVVIRCGIDRERQGIPGNVETAHGFA
jgi:hypothetical protein